MELIHTLVRSISYIFYLKFLIANSEVHRGNKQSQFETHTNIVTLTDFLVSFFFFFFLLFFFLT